MKGERTINQLGIDIRQLTPRAVMLEIDNVKIQVGSTNQVIFPEGDGVLQDSSTTRRRYYTGGVSVNTLDRHLTERQIRIVKERCNEVKENLRKVYVDFLAQFAPEGFLDVLDGKKPFDILYQQTSSRLDSLAKNLPEPQVQGADIDGMTLTWLRDTVAVDGTLVKDNEEARDDDKVTEVVTFVYNNLNHVRRAYRAPAWSARVMGGMQSMYYFSTYFEDFVQWYAEAHIRLQAFTKN